MIPLRPQPSPGTRNVLVSCKLFHFHSNFKIAYVQVTKLFRNMFNLCKLVPVLKGKLYRPPFCFSASSLYCYKQLQCYLVSLIPIWGNKVFTGGVFTTFTSARCFAMLQLSNLQSAQSPPGLSAAGFHRKLRPLPRWHLQKKIERVSSGS